MPRAPESFQAVAKASQWLEGIWFGMHALALLAIWQAALPWWLAVLGTLLLLLHGFWTDRPWRKAVQLQAVGPHWQWRVLPSRPDSPFAEGQMTGWRRLGALVLVYVKTAPSEPCQLLILSRDRFSSADWRALAVYLTLVRPQADDIVHPTP